MSIVAGITRRLSRTPRSLRRTVYRRSCWPLICNNTAAGELRIRHLGTMAAEPRPSQDPIVQALQEFTTWAHLISVPICFSSPKYLYFIWARAS